MAIVIDLLDQGRLSEAWDKIQAITPVPTGSYEQLIWTLLKEWISLSPAERSTISYFEDDLEAEFQFVPTRTNGSQSDSLVIVFCGMAQRFGGCPLALIHTQLGKLGAHLLYLRDLDNIYYLSGQRSNHHDLAKTLERIKALSNQHGIQDIITLGFSSGGFGALHWGLELAARRIVSLAGPTNLTRILQDIRSRQEDLGIPAIHRAHPQVADAAARLRHSVPQPQFHLVYASENENDIQFAIDLGDPLPPNVNVETLEGSDAHNVMIPLLENNQLQHLLKTLISS
jgi:hypothetical protein